MRTRTLLQAILILAGMSSPVFAFKPGIHQEITFDSLLSITKTVNGKTLAFTQQAITEVSNGNKAVDCGGSALCLCLSCQSDSSAHFDDENFAGGSDRLVKLRQKIIGEITAASPDGATGRQDLGAALHTLQDFYSHSNRVETGLASFDSKLGSTTFNGLDATIATCPNNSSTLGQAGLSSITSGYFPTCFPPNRKCSHGLPLSCQGINKDEPSRPNYVAASNLAFTQTGAFVNSILNDPLVTNNERAIRALMGIKSSLGFVVDTTGSMGDIIAQVQAQVIATVESVVGTPNEPDQYVLTPFNDPTWGPSFSTANATDLIAAVSALTASGGGDCPELPMHGLLDGIAASFPDGKLFLYTDASAKDGSLAGSVIAAAQAKSIQVNFFNFGSCSPIDPSYALVANGTGGQAFFLARSEAGTTFSLIKPQTGVQPVTILTATDSLSGTSRTFNVPVDSSVGSVTFSVSFTGPNSIKITRPSGTTVNGSDPGVTFTALSTGEVVTIQSPQQGVWQLQLGGIGTFTANVQGTTTPDQVDNLIRLDHFAFVTLAGRPGHPGFYQIPGQPVSGVSQTGLAILQGPFASANFKLVSQSSTDLQTINLAQGDPDAEASEFVGSFVVPSQPFRVVVTGIDNLGQAFQRIFPQLFTGESVTIAASNTIDSVPAGSTSSLSYTVTNLGPASTFIITASDNQGFISGVNPPTLPLTSGASGSVMIAVTVPSNVPPNTVIGLTATATDAANPADNNTTVQSLLVAPVDRTPPTINVAADPSTLWPPNGRMIGVTVSGTITDTGSGVDQSSGTFTVSDEDGNVQPSGAITINADGTYSFNVQLQSARSGTDRNGRQYTVNVYVKDKAGNVGMAWTVVTALHDQRR
jgi:hypothetical protein